MRPNDQDRFIHEVDNEQHWLDTVNAWIREIVEDMISKRLAEVDVESCS